MRFKEFFDRAISNKVVRFIFQAFFTFIFTVIIGFAILVFLDKVVLNAYTKSRKLVEVPYVTGLKLEQSTQILKEKKLKWKTIGSGPFVVKTEPSPGILVKEGRVITLYLANSPRLESP